MGVLEPFPRARDAAVTLLQAVASVMNNAPPMVIAVRMHAPFVGIARLLTTKTTLRKLPL